MAQQTEPTGYPDVALVTGGSSGIGRATALRLAARGTRVVVGYHSSKDDADALIAQMAGSGHMALRIAIDDTRCVCDAAEAIGRRYGKLDALVNSGGSSQTIPLNELDKLTDEIFDRIVIVNLRGPFAVIRAMRPLLEKGENAAIVNVSSLSAQKGVGSNLAYCAAKGGLDTLTIGLARVLAPRIRVISVSPAGVDTKFVAGRTREQLEAMAGAMPLRKVTSPDDVARAIVAGIVDLTSSTGIVINVDEGRHL
ncbi:SDR family oxidoreductase [Chelativorans sp. AA-79]|uniref:SDR family NAD(P)-dependent oxidoreductase n=1 Tax=Chelativorans sp. AA-79 TaxID=3028735 RepID=UPI0023F87FEE|nr:SDR family oxidoreductase [Chelativorans sp. AA-79]WEX10934.1 SDR family NAD(P)-dependent oxidoreductase [Chelativorans sp. AA-79]